MPEWLDLVLKLVGALALVLGPTAVWRGHQLARRTAQDTVAVGRDTADLQETTRRLLADLDVLKAGQATYQAYAEGLAKLVDAGRAELAAAEAREAATLAREADCQQRLTRSETRTDVLFRELRRLREQLRARGIVLEEGATHD